MSGSMRQLEERQLSAEVTWMQWSPKMDLLAIANGKGEVALHRLTWQRVWLLNPPKESDLVANLSWRPDGKLIAVTYKNTKHLYLVDVENKNVVFKSNLETNAVITCMAWLSLNVKDNSSTSADTKLSASPTGDYLPPLPNLNRSFGQDPERKEFLSQAPSILFLGQEDGNIVMYIYGMFYCGFINVSQYPILEITGGCGKPLWASWKNSNGINLSRLSCPLLENSDAFSKVAQIHGSIECLRDYLSRTLVAISEAWETILLELDEKLARYANSKPVGCVAADFLELLMIGVPSQDLENFLLHDLTEKGLKKLSHSIEMCYSNIQKLVLKHLHSVGMSLVYQLAEMRGMARLGGPYESIGLADENLITNAIHAAQAFLVKTSEIQQIIDHSMRDYKAFFRWLYVVILRLTDERVPSEMSRVSQQELTFIADFLRSFHEIGSDSGRKRVNLEKLGQYLRKEPLEHCLVAEGSEWATILSENECLRNHPLIVKQDLDYSLLQSHAKLADAITTVFDKAYDGLTNHFSITTLSLTTSAFSSTSQTVNADGILLIAILDDERKLLHLFKVEYMPVIQSLIYKWVVIHIDNKQGPSTSLKSSNDNIIADLQFYSQDFLSLLLLNQHNYTSYLIQLPISHIRLLDEQRNNSANMISLNDLIGGVWPRALQGFSARRLAVSGARKVAAVLSGNSRKIRLLETEVEPEEEEDDEDNEGGEDSMMDITMPNTSQ